MAGTGLTIFGAMLLTLGLLANVVGWATPYWYTTSTGYGGPLMVCTVSTGVCLTITPNFLGKYPDISSGVGPSPS